MTILELYALGFASAFFTVFINHSFDKGMIFHFYGKWLSGLADKKPKLIFLLRPMGICIYCMGTWVAMGLYSLWIEFDYSHYQAIVQLFFFVGIQYIAMHAVSKFLY